MSDTSMTGKHVLITGGTGGIGLVTAAELARMGAAVTITARNAAKGADAIAEIKRRSGSGPSTGDVDALYADLGSLDEVAALAESYIASHDRLDVLVNNAGAVNMERRETQDGFEMTFGVNHLAHFHLTNLLLPLLKASAPSRIVNVSSLAHAGAWMQFEDLQLRRLYIGMAAYAQSKLANLLHAYELSRRLAGTGVTANALHPGVVRTGFAHNDGGAMQGVMDTMLTFAAPFMITAEQGAETSIYLASSPEVEGVTGRYFDAKRAVPSWFTSYDTASARRLWEMSEEMVAGRGNDRPTNIARAGKTRVRTAKSTG